MHTHTHTHKNMHTRAHTHTHTTQKHAHIKHTHTHTQHIHTMDVYMMLFCTAVVSTGTDIVSAAASGLEIGADASAG